jgi:hypothetical protein
MIECAQNHLAAYGPECQEWRIDFVAVQLERGRVVRLEHYKHAVQ